MPDCIDLLRRQSNVDAVMRADSNRAIRPAIVQDLPGAYRVCLKTGDSGTDATHEFHNPDLLGQVFVGPYIVGEPENAFVVADEDGIAGYALAVRDTRAFEAWAEEHWWPPLREQYPLKPGPSSGEASADASVIRLIHSPPRAEDEVVARFPAHLHIDLLPRVHKQGYGRQLIEILLATLSERGAAGVHLGVGLQNVNAIEFYRHLGFETVGAASDELVMGKVLP